VLLDQLRSEFVAAGPADHAKEFAAQRGRRIVVQGAKGLVGDRDTAGHSNESARLDGRIGVREQVRHVVDLACDLGQLQTEHPLEGGTATELFEQGHELLGAPQALGLVSDQPRAFAVRKAVEGAQKLGRLHPHILPWTRVNN
jgi:hypothetical protein